MPYYGSVILFDIKKLFENKLIGLATWGDPFLLRYMMGHYDREIQAEIDLNKKIDNIKLIHGDCMEKMQDIKSGSIDAIIADIPFGTTSCRWDSVIPFGPMWSELKRIVKPNGPIVLFGAQPFTSALIMSNTDMYKYNWVWEKNNASGFVQCKNKPMTKHEDILVFSEGVTIHKGQSKKRMIYNPQGLTEINKAINNSTRKGGAAGGLNPRPSHKKTSVQTHTNYPSTVLKFSRDQGFHPTQKPVKLLEYLLKTYSNKGDTVLDFTAGSFSTAIAAINTGRKFIGIEMDEEYFKLGSERVEAHLRSKRIIDINVLIDPINLTPR